MKTEDFSFSLPEELIAQFPPEKRGGSRLLVMDRATGSLRHSMTSELARFVEAGTLMVFNDTKVRKARIHGEALDTGARVEFLLLSKIGSDLWVASCTKMKKQRPGRRYRFAEGLEAEAERPGLGAEISEPVEDTRLLRFSPPLTEDWLERNGQVPLPPYIRRADSLSDAERYQTIFAKTIGSAASPTAGLHFTEALVNELRASGVQMAVVTLHVGLGTFLPVRTEEIEDHSMHEESWIISAETAGAVNRAKAERRPVLAVGTTSLRTLESAYFRGDEFGKPGVLAGEGKTKIFIRPGYEWKVVDGLFTNFHTPRSTLLMLVSAFAGREHILRAYEEAIRLGYRFFSYGDAMLVQ